MLLYDQLASGASLYTGFALLAIGAAMGRIGRKHSRPWKLVEVLFVASGAAGVLLSSVPVPRWLLIGWCGAFLGWQGFRRAPAPAARTISGVILVAVSLGVVVLDLPFQFAPVSPRGPVSRIAVVGDSLSTGVNRLPDDRLWPALLARDNGVDVVNLSRGGARLEDALRLLNHHGIPPGTDVVLLEIGGNDLLEGTPTAQFHEQLDELLKRLNGDYAVYMFELPLPPLGYAYGRIQRKLAGRHGIRLIPKRHLSELLFTPSFTLDGLHPSRRGHRRLASWVADLLGLEPGTGGPSGRTAGISSSRRSKDRSWADPADGRAATPSVRPKVALCVGILPGDRRCGAPRRFLF